MRSIYEQQLGKIRDTLVDMSRVADANLSLALAGLAERNVEKAGAVEMADNRLDEYEVLIDEMVVTYMATHAPIATDCRLMLVCSKINTNLERIGDLAVTIARRTCELAEQPVFQPFPDIARMGELALGMLRDAIACFVSGEYILATDIIKRDREVDALKRQVINQLRAIMLSDQQMIVRCSALTEVARAIERVADHAKNIAEEVYYLFQAKDIRHEKLFESNGFLGAGIGSAR